MRKMLAVAAVAAWGVLGCMQSFALTCIGSPFSDVPGSDPNCSAVEWLKNRQITLGCGGSSYCPTQFVTRAQMALFMQRLADAVLQQPVETNAAPGAITLVASQTATVPCTAILAIVPYPRTLVVTAHGSFKTTATADVGLQIVFTTDGNTTNYVPATLHGMLTTAGPANWGHVSHSTVIEIGAGQAVKIGAAFYTSDSSGSVPVIDSRCQITGEIQSRTGTVTPF